MTAVSSGATCSGVRPEGRRSPNSARSTAAISERTWA